MNMTQLRVIIQYAVVYGAAYLSGRGYMDQTAATELLTAVTAVIPALYGVWKSRDQGKVDTAAKVAGVSIIAPPRIAAAAPGNVVSSDLAKLIAK